jgi:hypothetical protein
VNSFGGSISSHIAQLGHESTRNEEESKEEKISNSKMAAATPARMEEEKTEETFSARTSFTADSPYFTSYVEGEMRQVQVLSETLRDISARAKTFGKCGALMSEATRRLALACRLKPSTPSSNSGDNEEGKSADDMTPQDRIIKERQGAVGEEMMVVLSTLGEVC